MNETVKTPKVSVCVVTYNQEKYIRQCLQSIVDQETDFDFEVIVGDDCSTDGTREIVQEFAERYPGIVKPIYQKKNSGGVNNFLTVHRLAKGDYVAHIDGDDFMLPGKLQKQADFLDQNLNCAVVWHRVNLLNDQGGFFSGNLYDYSMFPNGVVTFSAALRLGSVAAHSSTMYRRSTRKTISPEFPVLDLFYTWEYLSSGEGKILDEVLGAYRVNSVGSISSTRSTYIRALHAHHADYYYRLYPAHRKDIFISALTNFLIDLKNLRRSSIDFLFLAIRTFSYVSPSEFAAHINIARKLKVPQ